MPSRERVTELIRYVGEYRFMEAIAEFYHQDAVLRENNGPPRVGLAAALEFEAAFLTTVAEWRRAQAVSFLVDGDCVAIHWVFEPTMKNGARASREEIAYQRWEGDRIVEERFFYDPGTA
ncbi:MAG: nuclear transport factor 2 family protein [Capsulimonas sp.]|uniref:nuclear transport factor 2 family protein n=1 Tax=Capsulimonas sp. TaxID=2494211 RepID=UPI0032638F41